MLAEGPQMEAQTNDGETSEAWHVKNLENASLAAVGVSPSPCPVKKKKRAFYWSTVWQPDSVLLEQLAFFFDWEEGLGQQKQNGPGLCDFPIHSSMHVIP